MSFEKSGIERKVISILKILASSPQAQGARVIARYLKDLGIELTERAVRYHLRLTDERGLTRLVGRRDGRVITELGQMELKKALVKDKVGFAFARIESLAFRTNFNFETHTGPIPVNISVFTREHFHKALKIMKGIFKAGICVSDRRAPAGSRDAIRLTDQMERGCNGVGAGKEHPHQTDQNSRMRQDREGKKSQEHD